MSVFSTPEQLANMRDTLSNFVRMPFSQGNIPGALVESVFAHVRGASVLNTYDFIDVVNTESRCGWHVKSTKASTPVTWKRAKIENSAQLIEQSTKSEEDMQALGDAIINFCNERALASMEKHALNEIGYSRLIVHKNGRVTYFERLLCSKDKPLLFEPQILCGSGRNQRKLGLRNNCLHCAEQTSRLKKSGRLGTDAARISCTSAANPCGGRTKILSTRFLLTYLQMKISSHLNNSMSCSRLHNNSNCSFIAAAICFISSGGTAFPICPAC